MGNCQAIDNASLVIQHPCGRVDRLYSPVPASQIMKLNPGHYVALLLTTTTTTTTTTAGEKNKNNNNNNNNNNNRVRITRIKLLRPTDTLALGHAYRLITTQEVMKGLWAKKCAKMKKREPDHHHHQSVEKQERIKDKTSYVFGNTPAATGSEMETISQVSKNERNNRRTSSSSRGGGGWHPSLQSISESAAAGS